MYRSFRTGLGLFLIWLMIGGVSSSFAANDAEGFFRFPDVRDDLVVFTSEGDLWAASLSNDGDARRLTRHDGKEFYARISPDGEWIAFTGQYDGNADVFIVPSRGGEPERLTFHPALDEVVGWSENGKSIIFRSNRGQANRTWKLFSVEKAGGYPEDFGLDKGTRISFDPASDHFAYTRLRREQRPWKRYRGGWAMDIWVGNLKNMQFDKVTDFDGTDSYPMWIGDRIWFISDRSGRFNLFSMNPDGSGIRQHTFEEKWDLRWPSSDGKTIVYQKAMDVWAFDITNGSERILQVQLPTDRFRARDRLLENPTKYIDYYSIPNKAKRIAFAARGKTFTFPVEEKGYIRNLTDDHNGRVKSAQFSPDGKTVAMMSDASDEDEIWLTHSNGKEEPRQLTKGCDMWRFPMRWSPDGKYFLFADKGLNLWIADAESGKLTKVDTAPGWEIRVYDWSSDSKWIAWIRPEDDRHSDAWVYNINTKKKHRIDLPMTFEFDLSWDPDGKYLILASENYFNPMLSVMDLTYIYDSTSKFYMVLLDDETKNPFAPELVEAFEEEEEEEEESDDDKKDDDEDEEDKEEEEEPIVVDLEGLNDRIYPIPVDAGNYFALSAVEGKIYFGEKDRNGMMPESKGKKGFKLNLFDFEDEEVTEVTGTCMGYGLSPDKEKIVIRTGPTDFVVMDAGSAKIPEEDGHVSLDGWSFEVDPRAEWAQILREVWRWQRDFFYDPGMHGVNWPDIWRQYSALLPRVSNRDELNDLIMEMIGELNVGHAYIFGGDILHAPKVGVGLLGADIEQAGSGPYRINHVLRGDGWGDEPVSPLKAVAEGEYIVAVDGVLLESGDNIYQLLLDKGCKEVLLSINSSPKMKDARDVLVETLCSESKLRYFDWVRERREYVDKAGGGKVAYVHLPDMSTMGLSMWGRQYLPQVEKEALIIDVRYNGGGFVAPMILSELQRTVWSRDIGREGAIGRRPYSAFYGPVAAISNHEAGSDAETFCEGFKRLNLGTLFGTRTWGGWVGIRGWRKTIDQGGNTQPEFTGFGAFDGKWLIEGPGVYPDVEVMDEPAMMIRGEDQQLNAALRHVLMELEDTQKWPKFADPPPYPKKPIKINHLR